MIFLGICLAVVGAVMLIKPAFIWEAAESWKSNDATEPSDLYIWSTRFGGVMFLLVGIGTTLVLWLM